MNDDRPCSHLLLETLRCRERPLPLSQRQRSSNLPSRWHSPRFINPSSIDLYPLLCAAHDRPPRRNLCIFGAIFDVFRGVYDSPESGDLCGHSCVCLISVYSGFVWIFWTSLIES